MHFLSPICFFFMISILFSFSSLLHSVFTWFFSNSANLKVYFSLSIRSIPKRLSSLTYFYAHLYLFIFIESVLDAIFLAQQSLDNIFSVCCDTFKTIKYFLHHLDVHLKGHFRVCIIAFSIAASSQTTFVFLWNYFPKYKNKNTWPLHRGTSYFLRHLNLELKLKEFGCTLRKYSNVAWLSLTISVFLVF